MRRRTGRRSVLPVFGAIASGRSERIADTSADSWLDDSFADADLYIRLDSNTPAERCYINYAIAVAAD